MATFVRIVFPVFVVAVGVLLWLLADRGPERAERVEPAGGAPVRGDGTAATRAAESPGAGETREPRDGARADVPIPAGGDARVDDGLPPDPRGRGAGALVVLVTDRATGVVERTWVQLWRLDAPATADWSAGDRLQARKLAPYGSVRFDDLPAGAYRVVAERCRAAEPVTRVVDVAAQGVGETRLAIPVPREFPVTLRTVRPDDGRRIVPLARLVAIEQQAHAWTAPDATPRRTREGRTRSLAPVIDATRPAARPDAHEFAGQPAVEGRLGTFEEDDLATRRRFTWHVFPPDRVRIDVTVPGRDPRPRTFGAPLVPAGPIHAAVRAADPAVAVDVRAFLDAVPVENEADLARVRGLPVTVVARAEGHETAEFTFFADAPPPATVLARVAGPGHGGGGDDG